MTIPRVVSIAGTDPTGGAGAQADIKSIQAAGGFALSALTALVSQNTRGVTSIFYPPAGVLADQLEAISSDVDIDAVKIGMLGRCDYISTVRTWLMEVKPPIVVLDPVMVATSGGVLLENDAINALRELLPLATVLTPNIPELEILCGHEKGTIVSSEGAVTAAQTLATTTGAKVIVKAGHLHETKIENYIVSSEGIISQARSIRFNTACTHGTGCSMSSALATRLAGGDSYGKALSWVTKWLEESIRYAPSLHVGHGSGPIDHSHQMRRLECSAQVKTWINRASLNNDLSKYEVEFVNASCPDTIDLCDHVPPQGKWTKLLWQLATPALEETWELPFLADLRSGNLDPWEFTVYQRQDALYLDGYARALSLLAVVATDPQESVFWSTSSSNAILVEQELHREWLASHSDDEFSEATQLDPSTVSTGYINHLLSVCATEDYCVGIAAVLPCFWIYAELGERLSEYNFPDHPYKRWLDTYHDPGFIEATSQVIKYLELAMENSGSKTRERATTAFLTSCIWEKEFFDQSSRF
ncbi:bifunctional hydroxymethylpyrimidine kinase/phosphomethylpyrimidine kinase [Arcanobacterium ihumii]|uniref:bifunctional hydroxymethylpyrimidine kinase/phosphomethylpyrimidine kinase n=1 Tax=Arcanobacterium ihumii TaxID=2138162 RepID=UPI000F52BC7F|nr:bifunctional hydroxymethylpyrimidine kinase/phosphomethylpyrimidine kinase [Arcanobacterium ihumii]